jgi:hypothetical protein
VIEIDQDAHRSNGQWGEFLSQVLKCATTISHTNTGRQAGGHERREERADGQEAGRQASDRRHAPDEGGLRLRTSRQQCEFRSFRAGFYHTSLRWLSPDAEVARDFVDQPTRTAV